MSDDTPLHDGDAHDDHDADELQRCIEECLNCHAVCTMTVQYALTRGGAIGGQDLIGLLLDCAEACQTSANFMLRGSPFHPLTCEVCADVCRACAEACRELDDEEQLLHCAEVCEQCAESCERMVVVGDEEM